MKLPKSGKFVLNALPLMAIALVGFIAYQKYQSDQAVARPDYDNPKSEYKPKLTGELPRTTPHQVKRVIDGDTIVLENSESVRFCGIDAPETAKKNQPGQPFGEESKANLQRLIDAAGGKVIVADHGRDRHERITGEVFVKVPNSQEEKLLNYEQVRAGLAYEYKQYSGKCMNGLTFEDAEKSAQSERRGVWKNGGDQRPWDYRKQQRGG